jgi:hypothetical protein
MISSRSSEREFAQTFPHLALVLEPEMIQLTLDATHIVAARRESALTLLGLASIPNQK